MILFLDTVSSLPEFFLIEDNKIISSKKIIDNSHEKMSDCIVSKYIEIENKFSLKKNLTDIIVNTGPGSYTALRIGIAFVSGISISQKISLQGLSCLDLYRNYINNKDLKKSAFFIVSSNDQKFICVYDIKKNMHKIIKIENEKDILNLIHMNIKKIYFNNKININNLNSHNLEYKILGFDKLVTSCLSKILKMPKQRLIEPIYCSNNQTLN